MRDRGADPGSAEPAGHLRPAASISCHFPITVRIAGTLGDDQLGQLAAQVERAVTERITSAGRELRGVLGGHAAITVQPAGPGAAPAESLVAGHLDAGAGTYHVASYDAGGALVSVSVVPPPSPALRAGDDVQVEVFGSTAEVTRDGSYSGRFRVDAQGSLVVGPGGASVTVPVGGRAPGAAAQAIADQLVTAQLFRGPRVCGRRRSGAGERRRHGAQEQKACHPRPRLAPGAADSWR